MYYNQLYSFIWRRVGDQDSTKDILQDLFLNVWKLRDQLDETKSIKSYLFTSANNLIINFLKRKSSLMKKIGSIPIENLSIDVNGQQEMDAYLNDALNGISEKLKIVFIMNKFEGFKYQEIAEILNISVKTVENRMSKILKLLRKKFSSPM